MNDGEFGSNKPMSIYRGTYGVKQVLAFTLSTYAREVKTL